MSRVVRKETPNKYTRQGRISDLKILKSQFLIDRVAVELSVEI